MDYSGVKQILKNHKLRITDCRVDVLRKFLSTDHALSTRELEDTITQYDRVTMYRTIHSFIDNGILHSIPDDSGFARYGICHETCTPTEHSHDHIHFKCNSCGTIECLPKHHAPTISIPGYEVSETNMIISGTCKECNSLVH